MAELNIIYTNSGWSDSIALEMANVLATSLLACSISIMSKHELSSEPIQSLGR